MKERGDPKKDNSFAVKNSDAGGALKLPHWKSQTPPREHLVQRDPFDSESLKRIVREMGLKVTQQRLLILEILARGRVHMTAQEVFESVSKKTQDMGFATVYRFLRKLTEHSLVTEVRMGGLPARYELTPKEHHDHLTCKTCGAIVEFENASIEKLQEEIAEEYGFLLTGHVLELYGVCPKCR